MRNILPRSEIRNPLVLPSDQRRRRGFAPSIQQAGHTMSQNTMYYVGIDRPGVRNRIVWWAQECLPNGITFWHMNPNLQKHPIHVGFLEFDTIDGRKAQTGIWLRDGDLYVAATVEKNRPPNIQAAAATVDDALRYL